MKFNSISLFSGAMGLDLGIQQAGFETRVCVEFDKFACETIRINTEIPIIERDINLVSGKELLDISDLKKGEVDLLVGGPPCQAFSTAGARRSLDDFRGNVIVNFLRLAQEIRPKTFLLENVRGLMSAKLNYAPNGLDAEYGKIAHLSGSVLYFLTKEFEKLGYTINFSLFDSANYGVPQRRERILMFGALGGKQISLPMPTHSEDGATTGKKWTTLKEALSGLKEEKMNYVELSERHRGYLSQLKAGQNWRSLPLNVQEAAMGKAFHLGGGKTGFYRRLSLEKPTPTLVTSPTMPATMLCHPTKLRPLSIEEYARIQQFPDNWKFHGNNAKIYKQIGNAVPVGLGVAAGNAIASFLKGEQRSQPNGIMEYSRYKNTNHSSFMLAFNSAI